MINNKSDEESHASESENKTTKTEIVDKNVVVVEISEIKSPMMRRRDDAKQGHGPTDNVVDINIAKNLEEKRAGKQTVISPPDYWAQCNFGGGNEELEDVDTTPLSNESDKNFFIQISFAILVFMLIVTAFFVAFAYLSSLRVLFVQDGFEICVGSVLGILILNFAVGCSPCSRGPPFNFISVFLAIVFMSLILAYFSVIHGTSILLVGVLATTVTASVCLCLACTSFDFTQYLLYAIVIIVTFGALTAILSLAMLWTEEVRYTPVTVLISFVGTTINVMILALELQMILKGRTVEVSENDYALGAFMLYTSIVDIFLQLIHSIGKLDK